MRLVYKVQKNMMTTPHRVKLSRDKSQTQILNVKGRTVEISLSYRFNRRKPSADTEIHQ